MSRRHWQILAIAVTFASLRVGAGGAQQAAGNAAPAMPPVTGLVPDHVAVSVENLEREAEWYCRVLGFKVYSKFDSDPAFINWHLVIPNFRIDLIKAKGSTRPPHVDPIDLQQGWTHVVFHVDSVAETLKTLQDLHVDVSVSKDDKGNPIQLRIRDPEGNEVEIRRNLLL